MLGGLTVATTSADRIQSLDIIRGLAVMGIFSVNVVGMAMIESAYFYPPYFGFGGVGDKIMWAANFLIVDGRFRAMFSILFGASMVLVIERGIAAGKHDWAVHYPRMFVLLAFGVAHFYLLWWGDILVNYALVGMIAFIFWRLPARWLLLASVLALSAAYGPQLYFGTQQVAQFEAKRGPDATAADKQALAEAMEGPSAEDFAEDRQAHSTLAAHIHQSTSEESRMRPWNSLPGYGLETLGLMLLGMAGYKSGFLTGTWPRKRYVQAAVIGVGINLAYFGYSTYAILRDNFDPFTYFPLDRIYAGPFHPVAAIGYCAAIILLFVGKHNALTERLAAVGRAAFTNYLGATLFGTLLFYNHGLGLYGDVSRGEAWLFAPLLWAIMLLWSKPWLDRFRYGPFEWAWRSLSRWQWEPMRKPQAA